MATLFDRLIGRPQQIVPMTDDEFVAAAENGYNKPLIDQIDWMNKNQGSFDDLTRQQWNNAGGYNTVRSNALIGNTSGIQSLDNFMDNAGLQKNVMSTGLKTIPEQRGFLSDLVKGYQENYNTPFSVENLQQDQNKGVASRIGEGLGTVARGIMSPAGRTVMTAGLISALGGAPDAALTYGLTAGVTNQALRTQDALYRKGLEEQGVDTSKIRGWITDDVYKNYALANYRNASLRVRQNIANAQDNTKRANLIMSALKDGTMTPEVAEEEIRKYGITAQELQISNATRNTNINEYLAPAREYAYRTNPQIAMGNLAVNQQRLAQQAQQNEIDNMLKAQELQIKAREKQGQSPQVKLDAVNQQLNNLEATFQTLPDKVESYTLGQLRDKTGLQTKEEANFNAQVALLRNTIIRDLGGEKGVLSDQDMKMVENAIPKLTDSYEQKMQKMKAIRDLLSIRRQQYGYNAGGMTSNQGTTQKIGNYTVRVK